MVVLQYMVLLMVVLAVVADGHSGRPLAYDFGNNHVLEKNEELDHHSSVGRSKHHHQPHHHHHHHHRSKLAGSRKHASQHRTKDVKTSHKNKFPKRKIERDSSPVHSKRNRQSLVEYSSEKSESLSSTPVSLDKYFFSTYDLEHSNAKNNYSTSYGRLKMRTKNGGSDETTTSSNELPSQHRRASKILDKSSTEMEALDIAEKEYEEGKF